MSLFRPILLALILFQTSMAFAIEKESVDFDNQIMELREQIREIKDFGHNPGNLKLYHYSPSSEKNLPMVVLLHGCTQSAEQFAYGSGWLQLAKKHQFQLLMPEQQRRNNEARCFNWFFTDKASRGEGETASIASAIEYAKSYLNINGSKVYMTGISGGGAMTIAMAATYPEYLESISSVAGVTYQCAINVPDAFMCMGGMRNFGPDFLSKNVFDQHSHEVQRWPTVSIWHGQFDFTVRPSNMNQQAVQWAAVHGIQGPRTTEGLKISDDIIEETRYENTRGNALVRTYLVKGMRHGQAVDPNRGCGDARVHFMLDEGFCMAEIMARNWMLLD